MRAPIMSTKTVAMRTESCLRELDSMTLLSGRLSLPPEQEGRGARGHEKDAVSRRQPQVLQTQAGEDLDGDGAGVERVEDDGDHEVSQGGDEGETGAGGERRAQQG